MSTFNKDGSEYIGEWKRFGVTYQVYRNRDGFLEVFGRKKAQPDIIRRVTIATEIDQLKAYFPRKKREPLYDPCHGAQLSLHPDQQQETIPSDVSFSG